MWYKSNNVSPTVDHWPKLQSLIFSYVNFSKVHNQVFIVLIKAELKFKSAGNTLWKHLPKPRVIRVPALWNAVRVAGCAGACTCAGTASAHGVCP